MTKKLQNSACPFSIVLFICIAYVMYTIWYFSFFSVFFFFLAKGFIFFFNNVIWKSCSSPKVVKMRRTIFVCLIGETYNTYEAKPAVSPDTFRLQERVHEMEDQNAALRKQLRFILLFCLKYWQFFFSHFLFFLSLSLSAVCVCVCLYLCLSPSSSPS